MNNPIYEPRGRAREYSPLALNVYKGCGHGCRYCYAPGALHLTREEFNAPGRREGLLDAVRRQLERNTVKDRVLLCFTCDPYGPLDREVEDTRAVLELFLEHDVPCQVLTKGVHADRDFDLLQELDAAFAVTMTFIDDMNRREWEPFSAPVARRLALVREAHDLGIPT